MIAYEIYFTGHVQGVYFRVNTKEVSASFQVSGYVQNCADGRVYLWVQGEEDQIEDFVDAIKERMKGHVESVEKIRTQCDSSLNDFQIRY
ncbi:MAG: acylphosphatase [Pseudomonadota bacterium]|nr:acylphosphatase [Pseudomonadota bacterium]